jgi:hypothetical protein
MSHIDYLVAANISKYGRLLAQAEPDHAQSIVDDLLNTIIDDIRRPMIFCKLEGISIFLHLTVENYAEGRN